MFSALRSTKTTLMVMVMMAVMMSEAAVMPKSGGQSKHSLRTHRKSSDGAAVETVPLQLDPEALVPPQNIRPLQNTSISPWTYTVSHDADLFPQTLSEARCLLRGCLDSEGQEDLNLESRPIMHQVLQLRRVTSPQGAGLPHFRLEPRLLAVGCTCVRPAVQQQR